MPAERFQFIQKGSNAPVNENKTLISAFRDALDSPECFQFTDVPEQIAPQIDLVIGFMTNAQFNEWFDDLCSDYNWLKKIRSYQSAKNDNNTSQLQKKPKRQDYSEEIYYYCSLLGQYEPSKKAKVTSFKTNAVPTIKTGCGARLIVKKPKIMPNHRLVALVPNHNHTPIAKGRLNRLARNWIIGMVKKKYSKKQIQKEVNDLHAKRNRSEMEYELRAYMQIQDHHIDYWLREHRKINFKIKVDPLENLLAWGGIIATKGTFEYQELKSISSNGRQGWCCCMIDNWQKRVLLDNKDLIYLDSTHNVCVDWGVQKDNGNVYLYSIVVRDKVTGMGTPCAYMLTNVLVEEPLVIFLNFIKELNVTTNQFMIDCCATEINAIKKVYPEAKISICKWHIMRNIKKHARSYFQDEEARNDVVNSFADLFDNKSQSEAIQKMLDYKTKYAHKPEWLKYLQYYERLLSYWINKLAVSLNRENSTNNYIESYHRTVKGKFLSLDKKNKADSIIYVCYNDVTPFYMKRRDDVLDGRKTRKLNKAELGHQAYAYGLDEETIRKLVVLEQNGGLVASSGADLKYKVTINGERGTCSCDENRSELSWCRHLHIYFRVLLMEYALQVNKETNENGKIDEEIDLNESDNESDNELESFHVSNLECNDQNENEERQVKENNKLCNIPRAETNVFPVLHSVENTDGFEVIPHHNGLFRPFAVESMGRNATEKSVDGSVGIRLRKFSTQPVQGTLENLPKPTPDEIVEKCLNQLESIGKVIKSIGKKSPEKLELVSSNVNCWSQCVQQISTGEENLAYTKKRRKLTR